MDNKRATPFQASSVPARSPSSDYRNCWNCCRPRRNSVLGGRKTSGRERLDRLGALIAERLGPLLLEPSQLRVPAERSDIVAAVYQSGKVLRRQELDGAIELTARLPAKLKASLSAYLLS